MSTPTATELYNAACTAILTLIQDKRASVSVGGEAYTYQDLDKLRRLRRELKAEKLIEEQSGSTRRRAAVGRIERPR